MKEIYTGVLVTNIKAALIKILYDMICAPYYKFYDNLLFHFCSLNNLISEVDN